MIDWQIHQVSMIHADLLVCVCCLPSFCPADCSCRTCSDLCSILHFRNNKFLISLKLLQCWRKFCWTRLPLTPPPPPRGHCPPWGDAHCMWLLNFAASLHLQHISAAVLPRYELSGQAVFAAGNGLFFFSCSGPAAAADVLRNHFYRREPPIKPQTLFYLFTLWLQERRPLFCPECVCRN